MTCCWGWRGLGGRKGCAGLWAGRGGAKKAQEMCRLVLPGVRTGLGCREEMVYVVYPQTVGNGNCSREWGCCPSAHKCCFSPLASLARRGPQCFTRVRSRDREAWKVLRTTDVGHVMQGQAPDYHIWGGGGMEQRI